MYNRIFSLLLVLWFLTACTDPAMEDLGEGYVYVETNSFNNSIMKGDEWIVDSYISEFETKGKYVFGLRVKSERLDVPENLISPKYGFFILDKETNDLREGLSKNEYTKLLEELNLN